MAERLIEARRRLILDMLIEAEGKASDQVTRSVLGRIHLESTDLEQVRSDMSFFERHGLATVEKMKSGDGHVWVCKLTGAGFAVARGRPHLGIGDRSVE